MHAIHIAVIYNEYFLELRDIILHINGIIETLLRFSRNVNIVSIIEHKPNQQRD